MNETNEDQVTRAALRTRFLNLISRLPGKTIQNVYICIYLFGIVGKDCKIEMYEQATVSCKIAACDSAFENIIVDNLKTPAKINVDKAILRTDDIISMHFIVEDICKLSNE